MMPERCFQRSFPEYYDNIESDLVENSCKHAIQARCARVESARFKGYVVTVVRNISLQKACRFVDLGFVQYQSL